MKSPAVVVWVNGTTVKMGDVPVLSFPEGEPLEVGESFTGGGTSYDSGDLPDGFPEVPKGCPSAEVIYAYPMNAGS